MKRLLIPLLAVLALPTSVNAFPWDKDLTIKSDVGEKFIIKESTVTSSKKSREFFIELLNYAIKEYDELIKSINYDPNGAFADSDEFVINAIKQRKKPVEEKISHLKLQEEQNTFWDEITYKTIYVDLNNQKMVRQPKTIACLNPNMNDKSKNILMNLKKILSEERSAEIPFVINPNESNSNSVEYKVCKKFAKF